MLAAMGKKKKGEFNEYSVEEAPPPPYSAAVVATEHKKSFWKIRRILLIVLVFSFMLLATLLSILLTRPAPSQARARRTTFQDFLRSPIPDSHCALNRVFNALT